MSRTRSGNFDDRLWHIDAMRTTLDIDDRLMEALMIRHPGETKTKAVEAAIESYVRRGAVDWFLAHAGEIEIEDVSAEMRAEDRRV
jgi:Arc/MetJ family transcription regulator